MTGWILNTVALFAVTIGALLLFLHLHRSAGLFEGQQSPQVKSVYQKHRRMLLVGVGLLAAWFVVQSVAVILT